MSVAMVTYVCVRSLDECSFGDVHGGYTFGEV